MAYAAFSLDGADNWSAIPRSSKSIPRVVTAILRGYDFDFTKKKWIHVIEKLSNINNREDEMPLSNFSVDQLRN